MDPITTRFLIVEKPKCKYFNTFLVILDDPVKKFIGAYGQSIKTTPITFI